MRIPSKPRAVPVRSRTWSGRFPTRRGLAALAGAVGLTLAACGDSEPAAGEELPVTVPDEEPGVVHVHGLGINPADGRMYVATHFGLWRHEDTGEVERVGDAHHDLMGFTVVGEDHFLASGHPIVAEDLPPLLGLIETTDAGETWRSVSLLGSADFHALRAAHGQVYGWNATDGGVLVSTDGQDWDRRSTHESLFDLVVSPEDPDRLVATAIPSPEELALERSDDGGRTWETVDEGPPVARLAWEEQDRLWGVGLDGAVWRSADGGDTWEQTGRAGGAPEAVLDTGESLVVTAAGVTAESHDGGRSWDTAFGGH